MQTVSHIQETIVWEYWTRQVDNNNKLRNEVRANRPDEMIDSGYCLDAVMTFPAGAMFRWDANSVSFGGSKIAYRAD